MIGLYLAQPMRGAKRRVGAKCEGGYSKSKMQYPYQEAIRIESSEDSDLNPQGGKCKYNTHVLYFLLALFLTSFSQSRKLIVPASLLTEIR